MLSLDIEINLSGYRLPGDQIAGFKTAIGDRLAALTHFVDITNDIG
jgi:hypothetical protein